MYNISDDAGKQHINKVVNEFIARSAAANQVHMHSCRCRQGGHAGDDADCASVFPRVTHAALEVRAEGWFDVVIMACLCHLLLPCCLLHHAITWSPYAAMAADGKQSILVDN
jgi:hypothetical protein